MVEKLVQGGQRRRTGRRLPASLGYCRGRQVGDDEREGTKDIGVLLERTHSRS